VILLKVKEGLEEVILLITVRLGVTKYSVTDISIVNKKPQVKDEIICGVLYFSVLIPLIFIIGTITKMLPTEAIIALQQNLGPVFIAWGVMYLLLDYGFCILGDILGVIFVRELRGNKIQL